MSTKPEDVSDDRRSRQKPESLRFRSNSNSLTVADIQKSLAWYRDVVGFYVAETWEQDGKVNGASLKAGTVRIVLSQDDGAKGNDRVKGEGTRLYLNTAQDIDAIAAAIKARGGQLASEPMDSPWGMRVFSLVDPDGFKITITSAE